jgi:hypothetical protein
MGKYLILQKKNYENRQHIGKEQALYTRLKLSLHHKRTISNENIIDRFLDAYSRFNPCAKLMDDATMYAIRS